MSNKTRLADGRYSARVTKIVDDMSLMDDVLMSKVFSNNIPATQLMLSIILERDIEVIQSKGQWDMKSPYDKGRSIRLDIFAREKNGEFFDCEVQKSK